MNSDRWRIVQNIIWLLLEKGLSIFLIFMVEAVIARSLTNEEYGVWLYGLNIFIFGSALTLIAGAEVVVPAIIKNRRFSVQVMSAAFLVRTLASLVALAAVNIYVYCVSSDNQLMLNVATLSLVYLLGEPFGVVINYFQAETKMGPVAFIRLFGLTLRLVSIWLIFAFLKEPKNYLGLSRLIEATGVAVLFVLVFSNIRNKGNVKHLAVVNRSLIRLIMARGLGLWPSLMFMYLFQRIDKFYVKTAYGYGFFASYGIATSIIEQAFLLIAIFIQSMAPILIYSKKGRVGLSSNLAIVLSLGSVIALTGFFCAPFMVGVIYGSKYASASELASAMMIAIVFFAVDNFLSQYMYRDGDRMMVAIKWGLCVIFSILLYWSALVGLLNIDATKIFLFNYAALAAVSSAMTILKFKK